MTEVEVQDSHWVLLCIFCTTVHWSYRLYTHIDIKAPTQLCFYGLLELEKSLFIEHSSLLLWLYYFFDVVVKWPGTVHDAWISPCYRCILDDENPFPEAIQLTHSCHILILMNVPIVAQTLRNSTMVISYVVHVMWSNVLLDVWRQDFLLKNELWTSVLKTCHNYVIYSCFVLHNF